MRKLLYIIAFGLLIIACSKKSDDPSPSNNGPSNPVDTSHGGGGVDTTTHHVGTPIPVTLRVFRDNDGSFVSGTGFVNFNIKGQTKTLLNPMTSHGDNITACSTTADASFSLYQDSTYVFTYMIDNAGSTQTYMKLDIQVKITAADIAACPYLIFNGFANSKFIETNLAIKVNKVQMPTQPSVFPSDNFIQDNGMGGSTTVTYPTF